MTKNIKKLLIFIFILVAIVFLVQKIYPKGAPGNIYKDSYEQCDSLGLGYKGMCYGNLAIKSGDISICDKKLSEKVDKQNCISKFEKSEDIQ